jgi:hypothetical protein
LVLQQARIQPSRNCVPTIYAAATTASLSRASLGHTRPLWRSPALTSAKQASRRLSSAARGVSIKARAKAASSGTCSGISLRIECACVVFASCSVVYEDLIMSSIH